jgi:DNA-directed RNA polymerase specialized sigma24 family protein
VRHYILANSGTPVQAQDIFAEGLAIMLEKKREGILHFTANPGTWLYGVCRNLWRNELRKRGKTLDDYSYEPATDPVDPETEPDYYDICREEIGKLGSKCRELLFQTIYESKKIGEIAADLGYSTPHSASTQKRKCLDRLSKNVMERLKEMVE